MFGLYSAKDVQKLVKRLKEEYDALLRRQKEIIADLKEQNRIYAARVSELEGERAGVADAMVHAVAEGERIKKESALAAENERRELSLLAEKCRLINDRFAAGEWNDDDRETFHEFLDKLHEKLGDAEESGGFNLDDVLSPKQPLDLEKLCMDLGLMEDDE